MKETVSLSCLVPAMALTVLAFPAVAQDNYPARPVRILVGFSPGGEPGGGTPGELARHIASEIAKWATVVKAIGARAD